MGTPLSELISYLSYTGTIGVGSSHETIKTLLQEFGSISITANTDQNISIILEFSNDGVNFDYVSPNTVSPGNITITSVVLGRWCKIRIVNASRVTANIRCHSFCQTIPVAIQAQIHAEGSTVPDFNVDNLSSSLFNDLRVCQKIPKDSISFQYDSAPAGVLVHPSRDLEQGIGAGATSLGSPITIVSNTLTLSNIYSAPLGGYQYVIGRPIVFSGANSLYCTMTCGFETQGYISSGISYDQMLCGLGYLDPTSGSIIDGFFIGYPKTPVVPNPLTDEISFITSFNGVQDSIPKSQWSMDRLDGDGNSAIVLDPTKMSTWRIRLALGTSVYLEYKNPGDNLFIPCHRIQIENLYTTNLLKNPSMSFLMYTERTTASVGNFLIPNGCGPKCSSGVMGLEIGKGDLSKQQTYNISSSGITTVLNVPTEIFSIRNGSPVNGIVNRSVIQIDSILISSSTSPVIPITIQLFKNCNLTGAVWVNKDALHEPTQSSSGTITLPSGYSIKGTLLNGNNTINVELDTINSQLAKGETLSIIANSLVADGVFVMINYSVIL